MTTADGTPLKVSLRRAMRRNKLIAFGLTAPLLLFILISFLMPIFDMAMRSVDNAAVPEAIPRTVQALEAWDGEGMPPDAAFAAMAADLKEGQKTRTIGQAATRLNYQESGMRSLIMKSARRIGQYEAPWKAALIDIDDDWEDPAVWKLIKRQSGAFTAAYYLNALDYTYNEEGEVVEQPEYRQIYQMLFVRTLWMSALITGLCLLLGFPVSYLLATLPARHSNLLMILVLLPFWTSLLVRTTSWIVMLQTEGVLNDILVWIGLISDDGRMQMIYNKIGTIVAMTQILLPFMILPLYSVMRGISPSYMRAARSLGANPLVAFWRVYVPQTVPGMGAGGILVFILAIGYYITPALVGGQSGQLISNYIAYHMQQSLNWGLAAAIGTILLGGVLVLYLIYNRIVGIDNMKLG
ncbi:ABC transporter permease [Ferruginivarius sediminum]|uniref:ABC transporter permease n=2 Tax=Ferruginivarius sediminum TaxID=2661937 RepID=A0A369TBB1_9PROT|nr:ABC transporter permease [Ferruginivarius sediminum]